MPTILPMLRLRTAHADVPMAPRRRTSGVLRSAVRLAAACALAVVSAAPVPTPASAAVIKTNLALAVSVDIGTLVVDGRRAAFLVSEPKQNQDLNADGDKLDSVLFTYNAQTGAVRNHGVGVDAPVALRGRDVLYLASEAQNGIDYNQDGVKIGNRLHHIDLDTLQVSELQHFVTNIVFDEAFAVLAVNEFGNGSDYNGDGDRNDQVIATLDVASAKITSLGRAVPTALTVVTTADSVTFMVSEATDGNRDLNNDGDTLDTIVFVHTLSSGLTTNLKIQGGIDFTSPDGRRHSFSPLVPFLTIETLQDEDLNGDGDLSDTIAYVVDTVTHEHHQGLPGTVAVTATTWLAQIVAEPQHEKHMNGDADLTDYVLAFRDHATGEEWNPALALAAGANSRLAVDPLGIVVAEVQEGFSGQQDLNGDGDTNDTLVARFDPAREQTTVFGALSTCGTSPFSSTPVLLGHRVVTCAPEALYAQDLNGDGDQLDRVAMGLNMTTGVVRSSGAALYGQTRSPGKLIGALAYAVVDENAQSADLNRDGDKLDIVLHRFNVDTGASESTGLVPRVFGGSAHWGAGTHEVFVAISEFYGTDLNGDGDTSDYVLHLVR